MGFCKMNFAAILLSLNANASVERISSIYKDLGKVQKIYLHPGLISLIEFPQNIIEVRLGNPKSLKAELSAVSPKELTLFLSEQNVEPTNIVIRVEKRVYVFDVIPSRNSHQDYIKITAAYGSPKLQLHNQGKLLKSVSLGGSGK